jgi:hypothetical protein
MDHNLYATNYGLTGRLAPTRTSLYCNTHFFSLVTSLALTFLSCSFLSSTNLLSSTVLMEEYHGKGVYRQRESWYRDKCFLFRQFLNILIFSKFITNSKFSMDNISCLHGVEYSKSLPCTLFNIPLSPIPLVRWIEAE